MLERVRRVTLSPDLNFGSDWKVDVVISRECDGTIKFQQISSEYILNDELGYVAFGVDTLIVNKR